MVFKRGLLYRIAALFFLSGLFPLYAQTSSFVESRFIQRLTWIGDEYALRYEVVIEREEAGQYREALRQLTTASFIEVSLPSGKYRYRVIPHNFFGQPSAASEWMNIEILPVLKPELENFSPALFYIEENAVYELYIYGKNLSPDSRIFLRRLGGATVLPIAAHVNDNRTEARLLFAHESLIAGEYEIVVINPGGTEAVTAPLVFAYPEPVVPEPEPYIPEPYISEPEKPEPGISEPVYQTEYLNRMDIFLGAAWTPLLPVHGDNLFFGDNMSLIGAAVRFSLVSSKLHYLNPGVELSVSWRSYEADSGEETSQYAVQSMTFDINLLGQVRFPGGRTAINFRLGVGFSTMSDSYTASATGEYSTQMNIGMSFLWLTLPFLYLEIGADYSQFFTSDYFGFIRPYIGMGYRF